MGMDRCQRMEVETMDGPFFCDVFTLCFSAFRNELNESTMQLTARDPVKYKHRVKDLR